jgi:hypothetical protein
MRAGSFQSALTGVAVAALLSAPALAETVTFNTDLSGSNEVPPVESPATGTAEASFDTESKELTWTIEYEGLSGPATAAHFHGPASEGENAGPAVPIDGDLASPIEGSATLDDDQASQLQDGMWYVNIHTEQNPDGEIRGQLTAE